jgi:hypothetical protein
LLNRKDAKSAKAGGGMKINHEGTKARRGH